MGFCSLPCGIVVGTPLTRYQSSHIVPQEGLWWPFIFPVNGIDPQKSGDNAYRNSIHLWFLSVSWKENATFKWDK